MHITHAQLKVYANNQGELDSWNSVNRGYSTEQSASKVAIVFIYVPTFILLVVAVLLVFRVIHTKTFIEFWKKVVNKKQPYYSIFFTTFVMITIINNIFFTMEIIGVGLWIRTNGKVAVGITVSKLIHILVSCLLPAIVAVFVAQSIADADKEVRYRAQSPPTDIEPADTVKLLPPDEEASADKEVNPDVKANGAERMPKLSSADIELTGIKLLPLDEEASVDNQATSNVKANGAKGSPTDKEEILELKKVPDGFKYAAYLFMCGIGGILMCGIGLICFRWKHLIRQNFIFVVLNFLVFVTILAWCIFPTVVLAFADPVRTSAVVSMAVFSFLCTVIAISIITQKRAKILIVSLIALPVTAVVLPLVVLYLYIIYKGVSTGGLKGAIIAFIPAALTAVTAWFGKRALEKNDKQKGRGKNDDKEKERGKNNDKQMKEQEQLKRQKN